MRVLRWSFILHIWLALSVIITLLILRYNYYLANDKKPISRPKIIFKNHIDTEDVKIDLERIESLSDSKIELLSGIFSNKTLLSMDKSHFRKAIKDLDLSHDNEKTLEKIQKKVKKLKLK